MTRVELAPHVFTEDAYPLVGKRYRMKDGETFDVVGLFVTEPRHEVRVVMVIYRSFRVDELVMTTLADWNRIVARMVDVG